MATPVAETITPDTVASFEINPGTLLQFLETRPEGGPRLKCVEGRVTLVSPGNAHEEAVEQLSLIVTLLCQELGRKYRSRRSTTWTLPRGAKDVAYEADNAFHIESEGIVNKGYRSDLAIEVVVSHPETKALEAGALLKIPELWVYHVNERRLTFYGLVTRGKDKGAYRPIPRSRAFPMLTPADVLSRMEEPTADDGEFSAAVRAWARREIAPRAEG